jgi:hypothetical protein
MRGWALSHGIGPAIASGTNAGDRRHGRHANHPAIHRLVCQRVCQASQPSSYRDVAEAGSSVPPAV